MSDLASFQLKVHGRVQGVFFRDFTARRAIELCITGYVCNLPDGRTVAVKAEGVREKLGELLSCLKKGPPGAVVEKMDITWSDYSGDYSRFSIER
ncbi:acylphosphatase [Chloroflexota bacterium]